MGCSTTNQTLYYAPSPITLKDITEQEVHRFQESEVSEDQRENSAFWTQEGRCTHDLLAAVADPTRLEQNQSSKHPSLEVRETKEFSLLAEELLTVDGFLGSESQFSLRVGRLVGQPHSSVPTHEYGANWTPWVIKRKKGASKGGRSRRWVWEELGRGRNGSDQNVCLCESLKGLFILGAHFHKSTHMIYT